MDRSLLHHPSGEHRLCSGFRHAQRFLYDQCPDPFGDGTGAGDRSGFSAKKRLDAAEWNSRCTRLVRYCSTACIVPSNFFMDSEACGACHKDIFEQWKSSMHHFASFNNQFYRKSIEYMQDVLGPQPSKWCAGCHDHAVFFNGRFERPIKVQIDTPEAHAGLSCTSCHSVVHVKSTMGQGDFTIEYPPLHDLAANENPVLSKVHDYLL